MSTNRNQMLTMVQTYAKDHLSNEGIGACLEDNIEKAGTRAYQYAMGIIIAKQHGYMPDNEILGEKVSEYCLKHCDNDELAVLAAILNPSQMVYGVKLTDQLKRLFMINSKYFDDYLYVGELLNHLKKKHKATFTLDDKLAEKIILQTKHIGAIDDALRGLIKNEIEITQPILDVIVDFPNVANNIVNGFYYLTTVENIDSEKLKQWQFILLSSPKHAHQLGFAIAMLANNDITLEKDAEKELFKHFEMIDKIAKKLIKSTEENSIVNIEKIKLAINAVAKKENKISLFSQKPSNSTMSNNTSLSRYGNYVKLAEGMSKFLLFKYEHKVIGAAKQSQNNNNDDRNSYEFELT